RAGAVADAGPAGDGAPRPTGRADPDRPHDDHPRHRARPRGRAGRRQHRRAEPRHPEDAARDREPRWWRRVEVLTPHPEHGTDMPTDTLQSLLGRLRATLEEERQTLLGGSPEAINLVTQRKLELADAIEREHISAAMAQDDAESLAALARYNR